MNDYLNYIQVLVFLPLVVFWSWVYIKKNKDENILKKIRKFLTLYDGLWSFPLAIVGFVVFNFLTALFSPESGSFDIAFFQPTILSVGVAVAITTAAILGVRMNFRTVFDYLFSKSENNPKRGFFINDYDSLTPIQRLCFSVLLFFSFLLLILLIYTQFV